MSFNFLSNPVGTNPNPPLRNVNVHLQFADFVTYGEAFLLPALAAADIQGVRVDISWDQMQTSLGGPLVSTYMTRFLQYFEAFQSMGIEVLVTAGYSPTWASSGPGQERGAPPTDPAYYADFCATFLDSLGEYVESWEVWNEPDQNYSWDTSLGTIAQRAQGYVDLLRASYPAIKAASPTTKVLGPVMAYSAFNGPVPVGLTFDWFENYYASSPSPVGFYDEISLHLYTTPPVLNDHLTLDGAQTFAYWLGYFMPTIERYDSTSPIRITEVGWDTSNPGGVTEALQATYLTGLYQAAMSQCPRMTRGPYWYEIVDDNTASGGGTTGGYGLYREGWSAKPSAAAMAGVTPAIIPDQAVCVDTSGNGYNGTPVGTSISLTAGQTGFGFAYQLAGGKVLLPNIPLTGAFTIELWAQNASATAPAANQSIYSRRTSSEMMVLIDRTATSPANSFGAGIRDAAGTTHFLAAPAGTANNTAWHHIALVWNGSTTAYFFVDGALKQSVAVTSLAAMDPEILPVIGDDPSGGSSYAGNVDEPRISNIARYTAAFTPPTAPFTDDANTTSLYPCDSLTSTPSSAVINVTPPVLS